MKLNELYESILSRKDIPYLDVKKDMRIAIVDEDRLDIMKVAKAGMGGTLLYPGRNYLAVAKICPGQSSMTLSREGILNKNELMRTLPYGLHLWGVCPASADRLGVLQTYERAYWRQIDNATLIKRISKLEMSSLEEELSLQYAERSLEANQY